MFFFKRRTWRNDLLDAVVNLTIHITQAETRIMAEFNQVLAILNTVVGHQAAQTASLQQLQTDNQTAIALIQQMRSQGGATPEQLDQLLALGTSIDGNVTSATATQTSIDTALAGAVSPPAPTPAPTDAGSPAAPPADNPPADPPTT